MCYPLLGQAPTAPATNISFNNLDGDRMSVFWTRGNGSNRIVVVREGSPVTSTPSNGTDYIANSTFGNGNELTPGEFVVYKGTGTSVTFNGLQASTTYYVKIFEYNGSGSQIEYLTTSFGEGSETTVSAPTTQTSDLNASNVLGTSLTLNWTRGDGNGRLIIGKQGSPVDVTPEDLTRYSRYTTSFGHTIDQIGSTGNYVVYVGTGTNTNITGLAPGETYHFAAFEYNGSQGPVYLSPPATFSQTTTTYPTTAATNLNFSSIDGDRFYTSFTRGNGAKRIVVISESEITGLPADNITYNANSIFGSGDTIADGEYVVYNNTGTGITISNLNPGTEYFVKVFEYNESGTNVFYLRDPALAGSQSTAIAPTTQTSDLNVTNLTGTSLRLNWTRGDGNGRLIIGKQGSPVDVTPEDLTRYSRYTTSFGHTIDQIGSTGNYVVYVGTGTNTNITGLAPGETYHFAAFEYNGSQGPVYLSPPATFSQTTTTYPTTAATNLNFSSIDGDRFYTSFTRGNGAKRIVVISESEITGLPADNITYNANSIFGSGDTIADGEYVVYNNTGTGITISNLNPGTEYFVKVFEYNESGANKFYLRTPALEGSQSTASAPTMQASNGLVYQRGNTSIGINWTRGNGQRVMVVARADSPVDVDPEDLTYYSSHTNYGFREIGTGNYIVYNSTGNNVIINNLTADTNYHFRIYEYNGYSNPVYLKPAYEFQTATFGARPTIQTSAAQFTNIGASSAQISMTSGNGPYRVVFARKNNPVEISPADATEYLANNQFGQGTDLGNGTYVIYNGTSSSFSLQNLDHSSTYHLSVFEYNIDETGQIYLTPGFNTQFNTATPPTVNSNDLVMSAMAENALTLNWNTGNGIGRMLVMMPTGGGTIGTPVHGQNYTSNTVFGNGSMLGDGYVVYYGTGNNVVISGFDLETSYEIQIFEFNGIPSDPAYAVPAYSTSLITTEDQCPDDPDKTEPGACGCGVPDTDSDGDGTPDCLDLCPDDPNKTEPGTCGCGVDDVDTDADGVPDCIDGCPDDSDKIEPGVCGCGVEDIDSDGDGVLDCEDLCPDDPNKTEPGECGCGVEDLDSDGDGIMDCNDNCPYTYNPDQEDMDGDGIGDVCDDDIDGDGVPNDEDCQPLNPNSSEPGIWYLDNDGDGYGDSNNSIVSCEQVAGYVANADDCDDNDADLNPANQYFTFSGRPGFENSLINPIVGAPVEDYQMEVLYFDSRNQLPPYGFPRIILDYEGNGNYTNINDRSIILMEDDPTDTNTANGKLYVASISTLPAGQNYEISAQIVNGNCQTVFGPFDAPDVLLEADLEIFANDIQFSNSNPGVNSPLQITATIHNTGDIPASNFVVKLINQFDPSIEYEELIVNYVAPNSSTDVVWNIITPSVPAWCPMQVIVDYTNVIAESNELDNSAVRPFTNGDYNIPGRIDSDLFVTPNPGLPSSNFYLRGSAEYGDTAVELEDPSVAGATVEFTLVETGQSFSGYTNSAGNFSIRIHSNQGWENGRTYHVQGTITDFTLTHEFETEFSIICNGPDLVTNISLSPSTHVGSGTSNASFSVTNRGCEDVIIPTTLEVTQTGGNPSVIGEYIIPPLAVNETYNFSLGAIEFAGDPHINLTYQLTAEADVNNEVVEINENNFARATVTILPPKPDLTTYGGTMSSRYLCQVGSDVGFTIRNIGHVPSDDFDYILKVYYEGSLIHTYEDRMLGINNGSSRTFYIPNPYTALGQYSFQLSVDVEDEIEELREDNNIGNWQINILECTQDLSIGSCGENQVRLTTLNPELSDVITILARIRNSSSQPVDIEDDIAVGFYLSQDSDMVAYNSVHPNGLNSGEFTDISITIPFPGNEGTLDSDVPTNLHIKVDPLNQINESNENNNEFFGNLCYDFEPKEPCGNSGPFYGTNIFAQNQNVVPWVRVDNHGMFGTTNGVTVKFEVQLPGESDWVQLGNNTVDEVLGCRAGCSKGYNVYLPTSFVFNEVGEYTFRFTVDPDNDYNECNKDNNVLYRTVTVGTRPDLRVLSQFINPSLLNPDPNEPVTFYMTYENIGSQNITDRFSMLVKINNDDWQTVDNLPGLLRGANHTIEIPTAYSFSEPGAHVVRIIIDSENEIVETNEMNNEATRAIIVGEAANLYFESFISNNYSPLIGNQITLTSEIANNGDVDANAQVDYYFVNNVGDRVFIGSLPISVDNHSDITITKTWTVSQETTEIIAVITNTDTLEFNELDNEASLLLGTFGIELISTDYCSDTQMGSLMANPLGGNAPYTYLWNTGSSEQVLTGSTGNYIVTITDADGLVATASGYINLNPECDDNIIDSDGDGIPDDIDNCPNTYNPDQEDTDGDGVGDACDNDIDGDGILNEDDCDPYDPLIGAASVWYEDADGDGFGNPEISMTSCSQPNGYVDNGSDCDDTDNTIYPGATEIPNDGIDQDCDGSDLIIGGEDSDGDGIPDDIDNCPNTYNPDQEDSNNDGIGDHCEPCSEPYLVEITRTSNTTSMMTAGNQIWKYQGSANRAGRPLRPYPMYGMDNMSVPFEHRALVPTFEYDVWLRTICGDGSFSAWAGPFFIPLYGTNMSKGPIMQLIPNPTEAKVNISKVDARTVEVYDMNGGFIKTFQTLNNQFDLTGLPTGKYNLRVIDSEGNIHYDQVIKK